MAENLARKLQLIQMHIDGIQLCQRQEDSLLRFILQISMSLVVFQPLFLMAVGQWKAEVHYYLRIWHYFEFLVTLCLAIALVVLHGHKYYLLYINVRGIRRTLLNWLHVMYYKPNKGLISELGIPYATDDNPLAQESRIWLWIYLCVAVIVVLYAGLVCYAIKVLSGES